MSTPLTDKDLDKLPIYPKDYYAKKLRGKPVKSFTELIIELDELVERINQVSAQLKEVQ